jgi:creatinase/prolidase-like protein
VTALARVLDEMHARDIDALFLGREGNVRYLTGAARLYLAGERAFAPGCVVVRATGAVHLLSVGDGGIPADVPHANLYPISWNPATMMTGIAAMPGLAGARRIGVDGLTPLFEQLIGSFFAETELVDAEAMLRALRRVKTAGEVDAIRAAIAVARRVMDAARRAARDHGSDRDVVAAAMAAMAEQGVTTAAFEPVITRGEGFVGIDVGVLREGWEGGFGRPVDGSDRPPREHERAIARCRAGVAARVVGEVYGVGCGYEVVAPDDVLEPGMVISVTTAPWRDLVLVGDGPPEVLTDA